MSETENYVNEEDFDVITIDYEDVNCNYTAIPYALIHDQSISPACRWLIIYLMCNPPDWTIKRSKIWDITRGYMGRRAVSNVLNEAIEAGYLKRTILIKKTPKGQVRGFSYRLASSPKFKIGVSNE